MSINKTKVLHLGRFAPPMHGAAKMNELYLEGLKKDKDFEAKKIRINYSKKLEEIGKFNLMKFLGVFIVWFKLLYQLIVFRPNKIYFELAPTGFAFLRDSIYVWLCKIFRKKIVFHLHAKGIRTIRNKFLLKYYQAVFRKTKVIILSEVLYKDIEKVVPKKNTEIVPNGIPNEITDKEFNKILKKREKSKKPILLFLSNMIESKGPLDVLEICRSLKENKIEFECLFVGPWESKDMKEKFYNLVEKYNLGNNCKYLGPKYGEEKKEIFSKANFFIFPTKYPKERFPLVILESFMYGLPVLSYDNGAIKEIINKKYLGFVSDKNTPKELSKWLKKNIKKKQKPKKIRKEFKNNYDIKVARDELKKILKDE